MALIFMDSFAHYNIGQMNRKWLFNGGSRLTAGNNGGIALAMGSNAEIGVSLPYRNYAVVGFRIKFDNASAGSRLYSAIGIGGSRGGRIYISLYILPDGKLAVYAGDASLLLGDTGDFKVHAETWYYFELKYTTFSTIDINTGLQMVGVTNPTLRIDGTTRITGGSGSVDVDEHFWITPAGSFDIHQFDSNATTSEGMLIQDLYIFDNTGGVNIDFAGDSRMGCIYPRADISTDWTPSTGSSHFNLVNEHICDDDITYISSDTAGNHDEYNFDLVTIVGEIVAAQFLICARKDDEGSRSLKGTMDNVAFTVEEFINDSYVYYRKPFDLNPPQDATTFNAHTWGVEVIS